MRFLLSLVAVLLPCNVAAFVATSIVSSRKQLLTPRFRSSHQDTTDKGDLDDPLVLEKHSRSPNRRDVLQSAIKANILGAALTASSESVSGATSPTLLADLPMIRLKLPSNGLGRDYIATKICLSGDKTSQPVEFMIDTGLSLEMITPHLRDELGLRSIRTRLQGLTATGANQGGTEIVDLVDASLCQSTDGSAPSTVASTNGLPLPTLHAVVGDFPQEHMDPKHPVEGMLGLEVLSLYDVDFDFASERIRLYQPGTGVANAVGKETAKLVEIPALVINDTGILGIRVTTPTSKQPILGFLDCGSSFSVVNWKAAEILGLPPKSDSAYKKGPKIAAFGVDGRPIELSTLKQELSFLGDAKRDAAGRLSGFVEPPSVWKNWDPVYLAVGDLPVFPELLGDGVRPYTGPAALIGLDILAQRRFILESAAGNKENTRRRRIFVSAA
jgi:Aspartyl protease